MLKKVLAKALFLAIAVSSTGEANYSGAGSSGGGLILKDAFNPWFLQNTQEVQYCIVHDPQAFSLDLQVAQEKIQAAFGYWKNELQKARFDRESVLKPPMDQFKVGTQKFVEGPCDANARIIFQLGSMTAEQKAMSQGVDSVIAETIRTAYDRVELRGSGFIYVAPDRPSPNPRPRELTDGFWSRADGKLFYLTIAHELGHVFGLPDSGQSDYSLMGYRFVEDLVNWPAIYEGLDDTEIVKVTKWVYGETCYKPNNNVWAKWYERVLGIPTANSKMCSKRIYRDNKVQVYAGPNETELNLVGETHGKARTELGDPLVIVSLSPEQKVYEYKDPADARQWNQFTAVKQELVHFFGVYRVLATGKETQVMMTLRPGSVWQKHSVPGVVDGQLFANIFAYPPYPEETY